MAGLLMALEQSIVMGIALVYLFYKMLSEAESEQQRRERYEARATRSRAPPARARGRRRLRHALAHPVALQR